MTTTAIRAWGKMTWAYADCVARQDGTSAVVVKVYDSVAGNFTACHSLTPAQIKHVISRTLRAQTGTAA
jgi:hypothetical protein